MIIDLYLFIYTYLPRVLRVAFWADYLRALLQPLFTLNQYTYEAIGYNSSLGSQELYLNNLFGIPYNVNDRLTLIGAGTIIYIENYASTTPQQFVYNNSEGQTPLYVYNNVEAEAPLYLFNNVEFYGPYDFTVYVPSTLTFDINMLKGKINRYLPIGRRYQILTY